MPRTAQVESPAAPAAAAGHPGLRLAP
jgi:hypothetical protein